MDVAAQESENFTCKILVRNPEIQEGFLVPYFRQCKRKKIEKIASSCLKLYLSRIVISTRRFFAIPSGVAFDAMGTRAPKPCV